jgi:sulfite exporter TauE/SafE
LFAEAAMLGLASGPACLASCGPVLAPALAAQGKGIRGTAGWLGVFLTGRLAGYLGFSILVWAAGLAAPQDPSTRALLFGAVDLGLAAMLVIYATALRQCPAARDKPERLVTIGKPARAWAPATLGVLTGLNVCPPFLAAGARAAEAGSLAASVGFFVVFFLGTAVWSVPLVGIGWLRKLAAVAAVARITMLILAAWYVYLGIVALSWRFVHA